MFQESITKEELDILPSKSFDGRITVVNSYELVLEAAEYLQNAEILGFDTETKPSFKRGQINKVARITSYNVCYTKLLRKVAFP